METSGRPGAPPEAGRLGVAHLRRLWAQAMRRRQGLPVESDPKSGAVNDAVVFDGLGLVIEETLRYLYQEGPDYEAFEGWVVERSGGLDPQRIDRINAVTEGREYGEETKRWLRQIEEMEPVLDSRDLDFFGENGYVVVPEAVTKDACRAAELAIWEFLGKDPDDPDTWYVGTRSIFVPLYHHPALWTNRKSLRVHKAFSQVWGTSDLWPIVDRVSMNPPEREGFRFPGPRLHWDVTLVPPLGFGVQGLLYLTDTASHQGAFTCVPGFHKRVDAWLSSLPPEADPREQDLLSLGTVPVAGSAGDLIIYHQGLPHGGSPNRASLPRVVQFLDYLPPRRPAASWTSWR